MSFRVDCLCYLVISVLWTLKSASTTPVNSNKYMDSKDVNPRCPNHWIEFSGYCLFRPDKSPDEMCQTLGARSVYNLFCLKEVMLTSTKPNKCPQGWEEFHGHCLFLLDTNAETFCPLYGAVAVYNKLCVTDLTIMEREEIEKKMALRRSLVKPESTQEDERACCPNGFGK